ncbi:MAG: hypothetical protein LQ344_001329 [Seirophora lacunosa]|nr:MAG: hypothetical protein LQ344_001329 [Seirophora lacunosa]
MSAPAPTTKNIHLRPTASIHPLATLTAGPAQHPLTLHPNAYIHLRAHLDTTHCAVTIGESCIVSEKAVVGSVSSTAEPPSQGDEIQLKQEEKEKEEEVIMLGNHVVLESKSIVEAGARVGAGTVVEIGPLCTVEPYEVVPDHTVIYGRNQRRIDRSGADAARAKTVELHIEALRRMEMAARKK